MIEFRPFSGGFGAEICGLKPSNPLPASLAQQIVTGMDQYGICLIRNNKALKDEDHLALGRLLGPLMRQKMQQTVSKRGIRLSTDELIDVGNLDERGNIHSEDDPRRAFHKGNLLWHSDVTFDQKRATYSLLAAHLIPPVGGNTEFADMAGAYLALSSDLKEQISGLSAEHSIWYSRARSGMADVSPEIRETRPPARHPLVNVNHRTGEKSLYLASHASHVVGLSKATGRDLLKMLTLHSTQTRFIHRHEWRVGDIMIWDNLKTMHRGVPFDDAKYPRDMRRVTVLEE